LSLTAFLSKQSPKSTNGKQPIITANTSLEKSISESPERVVNPLISSAQSSPSRIQLSHYQRSFPPFFVKSHTVVAPHNKFSRSHIKLDALRARLDREIDESRKQATFQPQNLTSSSIATLCNASHSKQAKRGKHLSFTTKDVISWIQGNLREPKGLIPENLNSQERSNALLGMLPIKHIRHAEDVRPPYRGTFSMKTDKAVYVRLTCNPFNRVVPQLNYDYDSEAEWEEPEDGEDLDTEGDDEMDEDDGDEMDGFLDDEGVEGLGKTSRPMIDGDLKPLCTGICWEGIDGKLVTFPEEVEEIGQDPISCRVEVLLGKVPGCI
jgi:chromatin assembly factor 1 subunit A